MKNHIFIIIFHFSYILRPTHILILFLCVLSVSIFFKCSEFDIASTSLITKILNHFFTQILSFSIELHYRNYIKSILNPSYSFRNHTIPIHPNPPSNTLFHTQNPLATQHPLNLYPPSTNRRPRHDRRMDIRQGRS